MTSATSATSQPYGIAPPGYRLPDETKVGRVRLQVSNLARSLAWYEQVLGLRAISRDDQVVTLAGHGDDAPLVVLHERAGANPVPRRGRLGLYHFAILLPDRASLARFVAHLGAIGVRAGMSDHLVSEAIYLNDPDGLGIEVYADRPRATWRHEARQLEMATEPLDVADLLTAGGGVPWRGMPAGTVMGHVHLHVGDIARADAFYHAALGFDRVVWSYPGALFLSAGGYHHHLGTNTWAAGAAPAGDDDARLLSWELVLPSGGDVDAAADSLAHAGYEVTRENGAATVRDPWGTVLRLTA